jgi:exportin-7
MLRALELWCHDPGVTTPVLKLFSELAQNRFGFQFFLCVFAFIVSLIRSQRLQFDVSSPNGILLFREVSKVLVGYGTYV